MAPLQSILSAQESKLVVKLRRHLTDLQLLLTRFRASADDQNNLRAASDQLDELFLLVVVGEFNSGKSAFINALLGERVIEEGITPTTSKIQVLKHGAAIERQTISDSMDVVTSPAELLREMALVDTPGTNAIERAHEAITQDFVPRADLVFFITSADRPFTESERAFLEEIRQWGKKIVIVINKIDILQTEEDGRRIRQFVLESARRLLSFEPETFLVSTRQAMEAKQKGDGSALSRSHFDVLEQFVEKTLDAQERLRLKLLNPAGVAVRLSTTYLKIVEERLRLLNDDLITVDEIQGQLSVYQEDMRQGFRLRLSDVDNVLHQFENRGEAFFEEMIRFSRVFDLLNKSKMKLEFEKKVIADMPSLIGERVEGVIDWLVSSDLRQWQAVKDHLARRRSKHANQVLGEFSSGFEYDRARLLDTVGKTSQQTLERYNHEKEASRMAESVQAAVANTALIEVGAVGLGTAVSLVTTSTVADVTGMAAASTLAVVGFFVIPQKRRKAKKELQEKVQALRAQLMEALTDQFGKEVSHSAGRIEEAMAPYTRFVRAESERLERKREQFNQLKEAIVALRAEVEAL